MNTDQIEERKRSTTSGNVGRFETTTVRTRDLWKRTLVLTASMEIGNEGRTRDFRVIPIYSVALSQIISAAGR